MKYFLRKLKRGEKVETKLTELDSAILGRCKDGCDIVGIITACKPYTNKLGGKEFATTDMVVKSVTKLYKAGLLERR